LVDLLVVDLQSPQMFRTNYRAGEAALLFLSAKAQTCFDAPEIHFSDRTLLHSRLGYQLSVKRVWKIDRKPRGPSCHNSASSKLNQTSRAGVG